MILAAAAYAEDPDASSPPPELLLMWECRDFPGALPEPGGLANQPAGLIRRMRTAERVYRTIESFWKAKSWQKWSKDNPEAWKLKCDIDKLRAAHHA